MKRQWSRIFTGWAQPVLQVLMLALVLCSIARAADDSWILTTADFRSQRVSLNSITKDGIATSAQPPSLGFDRMLAIERVHKPDAMGSKFLVLLTGGDRAAGQPLGIEGDHLAWDSPSLGRLSMPLRSVTAILRGGSAISDSSAPQQEDVVTLLNSDSVRGIIAGIESGAVVIQLAGGEKSSVPLESISRISFAATQPAAAPARGFRLILADGSAITALRIELLASEGNQSLSLRLPDNEAEKSVPLAMVNSIEQVNGPVVWLSTRTPLTAVQTPFLEAAWPMRMDRAADGGPIRFGSRIYQRGIGVHSYSRLTFAIDPAFKAFRTQYAIDGDWPLADVTVRIKLDDKVVHERTDFHAGVLADAVVIDDLSGHGQITLEVDYGQNYDVQDRFNWIEPAFLNFRPDPIKPQH